MASSSESRAAAAFRDGLRRVNAAPVLLVGLCAFTLTVGLPLSLALRSTIADHLDASLIAERAASGVSYDWWQEFLSAASGLATTFVPSIIGFGAVLDNLSALADNQPMATTVAAAVAAWIVLWSFLSGGVLDRYARNRPTRVHGFFAAAGVHFWRFLRLGVLALAAYAALFGPVHDLLFEDLYPALTRDLSAERSAFGVRAALYLVFFAALAAVNLIFDYARVRMVVEDRRSAVGALVAGARFVRRHRRAGYLYLLNTAAFVALVALYALLDPGAPGDGLSLWLVLATGQLFIVARHYLKLLFYASEISFFQSALAHASLTAPPPLVWPESPAAEAIANANAAVAR